jgi:tetratricopeptide (TPR) repeat protein
MGLFDFFKKKVQRERPKPLPKQTVKSTIKKTVTKQTYSEKEFKSLQFQKEMMAFALWKYEEHNQDYDKVRAEILKMEGSKFTIEQVDFLVESLRVWNVRVEEQSRFDTTVKKVQGLINEGKIKPAFQFIYDIYLENKEHINLVGLLVQVADMFMEESEILEMFDELKIENPDEKYNLEYRKALFLKDKKEYVEAILTFTSLNKEHDFAWNYYQIAIIENLRGNAESCFKYLGKAFEQDPNLKADARQFSELQNLWETERFVKLTT